MNSAWIADRVLERAIEIQQIPSPTFQEARRAAFLHKCFQQENLEDVWLDEIGNVYARLPGNGNRSPVVITAHLDTVFPLEIKLDITREQDRIAGPGIGDNSLGLAGLFGLVWAFKQEEYQPSGDIWLVATVGEEGLGDLRGMRAVVDRFGKTPEAYLILEGMALGHIYHRGLGVRRYAIRVTTPGGHSWVDFGKPSAVHQLAMLVTRLANIPLPDHPRTSLNAGVFTGGISVNTIASQAVVELDLRSEGVDELAALCHRVTCMVKEANQGDVRACIELIGQRPIGEIPTTHPLVTLAKDILEKQGLSPRLITGSTDANVPLSQGLPAVCIGLTRGGRAHTPDEYIETRPLVQGMAQLVELVKQIR